jgi:hypothetical protein
MENNQDYKVSKKEKRVDILFHINQPKMEECILFLNQYSRFGRGEETLSEFLNTSGKFIPVEICKSGKRTIVNIHDVIYILEKERARFFAQKKMLLLLKDKTEIEVGHFENLPDFNCRILDFLNKDEPFASFLFKGAKIYINKEKIIRSMEDDEY